MFPMYIFKAKIAFSDHAPPGLKTVQSKRPQNASAEEPINSNFLPFKSEHLLKRIKPFRIVYLKSKLQDFHLSKGKHQNNGGSKVAKSGSGHIENNTVLFPVRS